MDPKAPSLLYDLHDSVPNLHLEIWAGLTITLLIIASLFNGATFLALGLSRKRHFWTFGHTLTVALSSSDFILSAILYPAMVINIFYGNISIYRNHSFCQISSFVMTWLSCCSTVTCCRIAMYRVIVAKQREPDKFGDSNYRRRVWKFIFPGISYAFSAGLSSLPLHQAEQEFFPPFGFCNLKRPKGTLWISPIIMTLSVFVPFVIMTTCFLRIQCRHPEAPTVETRVEVVGKHIRRRSSAYRHDSFLLYNFPGRRTGQADRHKRLVRAMAWSMVTFMVTHFPLAIFYLYGPELTEDTAYANLAVLFTFVGSTFTNSLVYGAITTEMREAYGLLLDHCLRSCSAEWHEHEPEEIPRANTISQKR